MLQSITDDICYLLPVSDDGGSTSEIVKVVGGPGIGDIRSRLVRLAETKTPEAKAVHNLLSYRLPVESSQILGGMYPARIEWAGLVEGTHPLWEGISEPYKETIRAFLLQFHYKILKQAGHGPVFDFRGGSIGNFFLTGCRLFFDSLEAAIFQFARITRSPSRTDVMSIIATTRSTVAIAAALRDGSVITGQCEISHPGTKSSNSGAGGSQNHLIPSTHGTPKLPRRINNQSLQRKVMQRSFDALNGSMSSVFSSSSNLIFSKAANITPSLPSPIRRIFYINAEQAETCPSLNNLAPSHFLQKRTVIYSMGSLYTSLVPCLIVPGVGRLLADDVSYKSNPGMISSSTSMSPPSVSPSPISQAQQEEYQDDSSNFEFLQDERPAGDRVKILLLNGTHDRETEGYTALDFVLVITDALNYSCLAEKSRREAVRAVTTRDVSQDMEGAVHVAPKKSASLGKEQSGPNIWNSKSHGSENEIESENGRTYLVKPFPPQSYITHLLYPSDGEIKVDTDAIEALGICCLPVPAPRGDSIPKGHYGIDELQQVLEPLIA
ncbi:hypothetical protein HDU96_004856 [Phlyctochytrium bullatum]|nr:hypothetical protein HDU96_004856 [Phlyctochytrium bullatum]